MKTITVGLASLVMLAAVLIACPATNIAETGRDTAASLGGLLTAAQTQNQATCTANPQLQTCTLINRGIEAQNGLITALETYCGFQLTPTPPASTASCVPVSSAASGLQTAIANANQFITELKATVKP